MKGMDTIQIHHDIIMHTVGKSGTRIDVQGYAVTDHDSLYAAINGIQDSLSSQAKAIEGIGGRLNDVYECGIGFHDSVSIIFVPLIIALFAFTMPLLFQVITHINSKYSSQSISEMFESSRAYKLFWFASVVSICFLFLLGLLSLSLNEELYRSVMKWAYWISLFVAVAYAFVTLVFVRTCIRFNSPVKLLAMISQQYKDDIQSETLKQVINKLGYLKTKAQFWKSKGWKSIRSFIYRGRQLFAYNQTESDYGARLLDLCKYAISNKNKSLFLSIIYAVKDITNKEKRVSFIVPVFNRTEFEKPLYLPLTSNFFKGIIEYYSHCEEYPFYEETIVRCYLSAFNKSRMPYDKGIVEVVQSVVNSVESGCTGIYEKYIRHSAFEYLYIQELPSVAFIQGADSNDQIKIYNDKRELWSRICDLHFLMNAFLISRGHYNILRSLLKADCYFQGMLYPLSPHCLLATYANCNDKIYEGGYWYWSNRDMFGRESADGDMLEKYTVLMMLITAPLHKDVKAIASDKCIKNIKECKANLIKYASLVQENKELLELYPRIAGVNFENLYDECLEAIEDGVLIEVKKDGEYDEQPGFWSCVAGYVESFFCPSKSAINQPELANLFVVSLPEESKKNFIDDARTVFRNTGWMPRGLHEDPNKGDLETIKLQDLTILMNKRYMYYYGQENSFHLIRHYEILFARRATYMTFSAISQMNVERKKVSAGDFEQFFNSYTKGANSEYVIIDTECQFSTLLDKDTNLNNMDSQYKGAKYKCVYLDANDMKDIPLMEVFRNSLIIIRKEDYPSLFKVQENKEPEISLEDYSDSSQGLVSIKVTMTPNMEIRYYRNTHVLMVELLR